MQPVNAEAGRGQERNPQPLHAVQLADALLRIQTVADATGLSSATIYRKLAAGAFAYSSQSEDATGRAWRKQRKVEAKLWAGWSRPKGMHRVTHERLLTVIEGCEQLREAALSEFLCRRFPNGLL